MDRSKTSARLAFAFTCSVFQFSLHTRQHSSRNRLGRSEARVLCAHMLVKGSSAGVGLDCHPNRAETSSHLCCPIE